MQSAIIAVVKRIVFALAALVPALAQPPAQQATKIQALIITGQNGHDWRASTPVLRKLLEDTGRFEVRVTEEFRGAGAETLAPYDVVILSYYDGRKPELRWGERAETALLNYVRGGKGVVVYHFALAAFDGWAEYEKLCAANWRPNNGHHSARHDYKVSIADQEKDHPIVRGMTASFEQSNDELYANLKWRTDVPVHVLANAWDDHALYKPGEKQPIPGPGLGVAELVADGVLVVPAVVGHGVVADALDGLARVTDVVGRGLVVLGGEEPGDRAGAAGAARRDGAVHDDQLRGLGPAVPACGDEGRVRGRDGHGVLQGRLGRVSGSPVHSAGTSSHAVTGGRVGLGVSSQ